jgi:hypothetical protein
MIWVNARSLVAFVQDVKRTYIAAKGRPGSSVRLLLQAIAMYAAVTQS